MPDRLPCTVPHGCATSSPTTAAVHKPTAARQPIHQVKLRFLTSHLLCFGVNHSAESLPGPGARGPEHDSTYFVLAPAVLCRSACPFKTPESHQEQANARNRALHRTLTRRPFSAFSERANSRRTGNGATPACRRTCDGTSTNPPMTTSHTPGGVASDAEPSERTNDTCMLSIVASGSTKTKVISVCSRYRRLLDSGVLRNRHKMLLKSFSSERVGCFARWVARRRGRGGVFRFARFG